MRDELKLHIALCVNEMTEEWATAQNDGPSRDRSRTSYELCAPRVVVPTVESQEMVLVRRTELASLKRGIAGVVSGSPSLSGWAFTWLGIGVGAFLCLLGIEAVPGNTVRTWVLEADIAVMAIGLFLAGFCGWVARSQGRGQSSAEADLRAEIDDLNDRAPPSG